MSRSPARPRVVLDCNTLVQSIAFEDGSAAMVLRLAEAGAFEFFVSRATLAELRRVLDYEEVRAISPHITPSLIAGFLHRVSYRATFIRRVPHLFDFPRDPKDEPYLDLSAAVKADFLVSRDKDLLSLMTGYSVFCKRFRRQTHPLRILDPVAFLAALDKLIRT